MDSDTFASTSQHVPFCHIESGLKVEERKKIPNLFINGRWVRIRFEETKTNIWDFQ